ncbi:hypothetical protein D7W82_12735 [Corallococcus sp. CA049B]|nr:hypothetical protein D7W82_12735 [Corallococcus sp. CA049B]
MQVVPPQKLPYAHAAWPSPEQFVAAGLHTPVASSQVLLAPQSVSLVQPAGVEPGSSQRLDTVPQTRVEESSVLHSSSVLHWQTFCVLLEPERTAHSFSLSGQSAALSQVSIHTPAVVLQKPEEQSVSDVQESTVVASSPQAVRARLIELTAASITIILRSCIRNILLDGLRRPVSPAT